MEKQNSESAAGSWQQKTMTMYVLLQRYLYQSSSFHHPTQYKRRVIPSHLPICVNRHLHFSSPKVLAKPLTARRVHLDALLSTVTAGSRVSKVP